MKRKDYERPTMTVVMLQHQAQLLAVSGEASMQNYYWNNYQEE